MLVGAGDIAGDLGQCPGTGAQRTAALLDGISGMIFTTGDNVYGGATLQRYRDCYGPSWGRHLMRTRPVPGNHDYEMGALDGYFQYFQGYQGPEGEGYYSYDYQSWHIVALNSVIDSRIGSPQVDWLEIDLSMNSARCTIVYWHHPLFSSGKNGNNFGMRDVWKILYAHNADIVLNGHDHWYERFAPQDPNGKLDNARGIRQFTVGTGGGELYGSGTPQPNSEVRGSTWGVLKLSLESTGYSWEFVPAAGSSFRDTGRGVCH